MAGELGLTDKQLHALRDKYKSDEKLLKRLRRWRDETRDKVHLLGKSGGYTERPGYAMRHLSSGPSGLEGEPEAIDPEWVSKNVTQAARERERAAASELIVAALEVRQVARERLSSSEFRALAGLSIRRLDKEIEKLIVHTRRKAA